jgi:hypothetical protein
MALRRAKPEELVGSRDLVVARAAARASLAAGPDALSAVARRLAVETDGPTRAALAVALAAPANALEPIATHQLHAWAESDDPIAPLAIAALGAREEPGDEHRLARFLESEDPARRLHAALALGSSPLPNAAGRLADAWRFEAHPAVRRAIVAALAQRREPSRVNALALAAKLDPDPEVREAAALGLLGRLPSPLGHHGCARGACHVAWISLVPSAASSASVVAARQGTLTDASGISLPVVSDPDGALVVPGIAAGGASFRLASSGVWYEALGHGRTEAGSAR